MSFLNLLSRMPSACAQGILWGLMALGVYITFRVLDIADLSVDGTFATGGAVTVMLIIAGYPAWLALIVAILAGIAAGLCTGLLHTRLGIPAILSGILTQFALYSVNLHIMGMKANQTASLKKYGMFVTFTDRVTIVADRIYVISTVTAYDAEGETKDGEPACLSCEAYAREPLNKKGMDESQITGTATSYARKNALAALFAVDSGDRDPDEEDHSDKIGEPEKGTNGLTALKMLDDLELAIPNYTKKMCAAKGVNDTSELTIEYTTPLVMMIGRKKIAR